MGVYSCFFSLLIPHSSLFLRHSKGFIGFGQEKNAND